MAKKKDSFLLYYEWEEYFEGLTDRQLGQLLRAVFAYEKRGAHYSGKDGKVSMALRFIQGTLDRNREKYENTCERNRQNGKKGGAPKGNQNASKQPKTTQINPTEAKQPDHDHDPDRDHEPDHEPDRDPDREGGGCEPPSPGLTPPPDPPSQREVEDFVREKGLHIDPRRFYAYYEQRRWRTQSGRPIDWQERARRWSQSQWSGEAQASGPGRERQAEDNQDYLREMRALMAQMDGEEGAESSASDCQKSMFSDFK